MNQRRFLPQTKLSYEPLFQALGNFLHVKPKNFAEKNSGRVYLVLKGSSAQTRSVLQTYFKQHSLLSSKRLDYESWLKASKLLPHAKANLQSLLDLKQTMNNNRTVFVWNHLKTELTF